MDWNAAIERNHAALKRVLAALVAMAGLTGAAAFTSPLWGSEGRARQAARPESEASGGGRYSTLTPTRWSDDRRPPHKGEVEPQLRPTLPRHLHRAVLRLLRPAEAAARRLVIVAACGQVVRTPQARKEGVVPPPVPPRPRKPQRKSAFLRNGIRSGIGTGIVLPSHLPEARGDPELRTCRGVEGEPRKTPTRRTLSLPLTDPRRRLRRRRPAARGTPRISFPGFGAPSPVRRPPSPDDLIDAGRLGLRLQALASALDDLPGQARRFARWRARRDAAAAQNRPTRFSPLRPGHPPGKRAANSRRPVHEVDDVLGDLQFFAFTALEQPDTS